VLFYGTTSKESNGGVVRACRSKRCSTETLRNEIENAEVKLGLEGDFQKDDASLAIAVTEAHLEKIGLSGISTLGNLRMSLYMG
jgi:hypothetical protein